MRAFLLYIDDWLSSKQIARMDAAEERGYLRLLLYAATEEDCGLPADANELANISLLGRQWFKPTDDKTKRIGSQTSGQKVLACFVEKDGRWFSRVAIETKLVSDRDPERYIPTDIRRDVLSSGICSYCGSSAGLEVDHIIPVKRGGKAHRDNLQPLCGPCNRRKGARV